MIPFELAEPTSLAAAVKLLNPDDPTIRPIAGGTALMLMMKAGVFRPEKLVSLRKIEAKYSGISSGADGLRIGAMTTLNTVERSADVKKQAEAEGVQAETFVGEAEAFEAITNLAKEQNADMIVIGSHGRTGLRRLLMGSVAEKVIGYAPCPVLVVKA